MTTIINFEKDQSVQTLPMEVVRQSVSLSDFTGKPLQTKPIEPWEYVDSIMEMADKQNLAVTLDPIFVEKAASRQVMWKGDKEQCPISNWLFNRLIMSIQFTGGSLSGKLSNAKIGINYTDKGIEVAYGQNIKICSNMTIMGRQHHLCTSGKDKMSLDKQMEMIQGWISRMESMHEEDVKTLNLMNKTIIRGNVIPELIGNIQMKAVEQAYIKSNNNAPFNIGQVSKFTKEVLGRDIKKDPSVYEIMNFGTGIIKPENVNANELFVNNANWVEFLKESYLS